MDFLKNNLFYVILIAAVLVISVPSFILASSREAEVDKALATAQRQVKGLDASVRQIKPVSPEAIARAEAYRQAWQAEVGAARTMMVEKNRYLDTTFLIPPREGGLPLGEEYRTAYNAAFDQLTAALSKARLVEEGVKSPLPPRANFDDRVPQGDDIRFSQKQYLILKEVVDLFTDPETHVTHVSSVILDNVPFAEKSRARPNNVGNPEQSTFWIYPMRLDFEIDFRHLPVFFEKLTSNENITFVPDGYTVIRAFDESEPVYVPLVNVSLYLEVWDYVATDWEKALLPRYRDGGAGGGRGGGRRRR